MGSAVRYLAINAFCPVLIIKNLQERKSKPAETFRWAICVDGSERSFSALHTAVKIIDKKKDKLVALSVREDKPLNAHLQGTTYEHFAKEGVSIGIY